MRIDVSGTMIVGCWYQELPEEILKDIEDNFDGDYYKWFDMNDLDYVSLWYDADEDGIIVGRVVDDVYVGDFDTWVINVKKVFKEVGNIVKREPKLYGSQDVS